MGLHTMLIRVTSSTLSGLAPAVLSFSIRDGISYAFLPPFKINARRYILPVNHYLVPNLFFYLTFAVPATKTVIVTFKYIYLVNKRLFMPVAFIIPVLLIFCLPVYAKTANANAGSLFGKVVDKKTKKPVEFASVVVLSSQKDSVITGALTSGKGEFILDNVAFGAFRVKISFTGYKPFLQKINLGASLSEQDLGNIMLEEEAQTLGDVTVTADKQTVKLAVDKKVFNVDKDISSRGGSATDVMKNIPGVTVDADGNVTMRNNTPQIYVDGKPVTISLDEIPSDQIERIEVITNPSASGIL